jgi:hypothetical protein
MDERKRRIGLNEAVFREANERIREVNETFSTLTGEIVLVCECGNGSCAESITMSPAEYEALRSESTHFAIVPGHELLEAEEVIAEHEGYSVVRKDDGIPRRIAELTDPR